MTWKYLAFFSGTYHSSDQKESGGGSYEEGEDIETLQVQLPEAMNLIESGEICDAKIIILLQRKFIETLQETNSPFTAP